MWLRDPAICGSQEEERERRMDFVPDESAINTESIEVQLLGVILTMKWGFQLGRVRGQTESSIAVAAADSSFRCLGWQNPKHAAVSKAEMCTTGF